MSQRVFKFTPQGNSSPVYKVGFGTADAGGVYVLDSGAEPDRIAAVENDAEFKELKGKAADDAVAKVESADPAAPLDEIAVTHPDEGSADTDTDAPAGEEK